MALGQAMQLLVPSVACRGGAGSALDEGNAMLNQIVNPLGHLLRRHANQRRIDRAERLQVCGSRDLRQR
jgi:hypothetical protein